MNMYHVYTVYCTILYSTAKDILERERERERESERAREREREREVCRQVPGKSDRSTESRDRGIGV